MTMTLPEVLPFNLDGGPFMALTAAEQTELLTKVRAIYAALPKLQQVWDQLRGQNGQGWTQLGTDHLGRARTPVDFWAAQRTALNIPNGTP